MLVPLKDHMLNGWVNTSSSAAPPVTAYRRLITTHVLVRHLEVRA